MQQGNAKALAAACHCIFRRATRKHWQQLPPPMQWANAKALATAAAACAMGQREAIGSYCNRICGRPTRCYQQQLLLNISQCKAIGCCCICKCNGSMRSHRQLLQVYLERVNAKASAADVAAYTMGQREGISSRYAAGQQEGVSGSGGCACNRSVQRHL